MGVAQIQLVGNVATKPKRSMDNPGHERVSFRVIANDRRFDAGSNTWVDGDEFSVTVVCWGALARGVDTSIMIGDPVAITGRILNRRYEVDGETRYSTEVKASNVAHDLTRGTATFRKVYNRPAAETDTAPNDSVYDVRDERAGDDLPTSPFGDTQPFGADDPNDDDPNETNGREMVGAGVGSADAPF